MRFFNEASGMLCIINEDKSYTLVGNSPDSVTDEELWDMAEGLAPGGWELVLPSPGPGTIQHNLASAHGGLV